MCANVFICMCTITLYTLYSTASDCSTLLFFILCVHLGREAPPKCDDRHSVLRRGNFFTIQIVVCSCDDDDDVDRFRKTALAHSLYNYDFGIGVDGQEMRFIIYSRGERLWACTLYIYQYLDYELLLQFFFCWVSQHILSLFVRCFSSDRQNAWWKTHCVDSQLYWCHLLLDEFSMKLKEMTLFYTLNEIEQSTLATNSFLLRFQ